MFTFEHLFPIKSLPLFRQLDNLTDTITRRALVYACICARVRAFVRERAFARVSVYLHACAVVYARARAIAQV